jgi:hypothetical protein
MHALCGLALPAPAAAGFWLGLFSLTLSQLLNKLHPLVGQRFLDQTVVMLL